MDEPYTPPVPDIVEGIVDWRACYNLVRQQYLDLKNLFDCSNRVRMDELELYQKTLKELEERTQQVDRLAEMLKESVLENTKLRILYAGLNQ